MQVITVLSLDIIQAYNFVVGANSVYVQMDNYLRQLILFLIDFVEGNNMNVSNFLDCKEICGGGGAAVPAL